MTKLQQLEEELHKKKYQKSIFETIKDTFSVGIDELNKSINNIFSAPRQWKNQINKDLEEYEKNIIFKRDTN